MTNKKNQIYLCGIDSKGVWLAFDKNGKAYSKDIEAYYYEDVELLIADLIIKLEKINISLPESNKKFIRKNMKKMGEVK